MKKITALLLLLLLIFPQISFASSPSSAHYQLLQYGFGNGGSNQAGLSSTNYSLFGTVGEVAYGKSSSTHFQSGNGLIYTIKLHVPPSPTLSNPGNTYDRLQIVINQGNNASDVSYAISISTSSTFASNINYVKSDATIGTTISTSDYKTYANWGGASGFFVTHLNPHTTYYVRARARVSKFSETEWGTISSGVATANSSLTFSLSNSSITFNPLTAGNSYTDSSQSTILTTTTNAYNGYVIYAKETQPLTNSAGIIPDYTGTNSNPTTWSGIGFGYTTNDNNLITGPGSTNRFSNGTKYAGFIKTTSAAGDPVADDLGPVQSAQINNEQFTIFYRITGNNTTPAGTYNNVIIYTIMATF
jgi:hypothetical protein